MKKKIIIFIILSILYIVFMPFIVQALRVMMAA